MLSMCVVETGEDWTADEVTCVDGIEVGVDGIEVVVDGIEVGVDGIEVGSSDSCVFSSPGFFTLSSCSNKLFEVNSCSLASTEVTDSSTSVAPPTTVAPPTLVAPSAPSPI